MPFIQLEDEKYSMEQKETMHVGVFLILMGVLGYIFYAKIYKYIKIASNSRVQLKQKKEE